MDASRAACVQDDDTGNRCGRAALWSPEGGTDCAGRTAQGCVTGTPRADLNYPTWDSHSLGSYIWHRLNKYPRLAGRLSRYTAARDDEASHSPWSSPVVMAPKQDWNLRFCMTSGSSKKSPALTNIACSESMNSWTGWELDWTKGYWQVALTPDSKEKSEFRAPPSGHWHYRVLSFGLHGANPRPSREWWIYSCSPH